MNILDFYISNLVLMPLVKVNSEGAGDAGLGARSG